MELHFRSAAADDLSALLPLTNEFYHEERLVFDAASVKTALLQLLTDASLGRVWLLEVDGAAIGYLILVNGFIVEFGGRQAFIDEFYIRPAFREQGFGRKALTFAEEVCRDAGIAVIRLEVECANHRLIKLYEEFGFKLHDRFTMTRVLG